MNSDGSPVPMRVVGIKQATKAIKEGMAKEAYLANGVDSDIKIPFVKLCKKRGIPLVSVESAGELGRLCGIDVGASVAVLLK